MTQISRLTVTHVNYRSQARNSVSFSKTLEGDTEVSLARACTVAREVRRGAPDGEQKKPLPLSCPSNFGFVGHHIVALVRDMQRSILAFVLLVAVSDSRTLQHEDCCLWHELKTSAFEFDSNTNWTQKESLLETFVAEEKALLNSEDIQYCLCDQGMANGYSSIYKIPPSYNASDRSNTTVKRQVNNQLLAHLGCSFRCPRSCCSLDSCIFLYLSCI